MSCRQMTTETSPFLCCKSSVVVNICWVPAVLVASGQKDGMALSCAAANLATRIAHDPYALCLA